MSDRSLPKYGYLGAIMVLIFWGLNWGLEGLRTHWGFFPLWLGYCLLIDAITVKIRGSSLISRSPAKYAGMFLLSIPFWWLFEWMNHRTGYWFYNARDQFTDVEYYFFASLSFSTVIPAMMGTTELFKALIPRLSIRFLAIGNSVAWRLGLFLTGILLLSITLLYPNYSAAFIWMSLYLIIDPVNYAIGASSLIEETEKGIWTTVVRLWGASLVCGFFWEMWNYWSHPKWFYSVPGVDFWYLFEMPALGYLGYLPFILECYAVYNLIYYLTTRTKGSKYLQLDAFS